jgi:hypothetical protein
MRILFLILLAPLSKALGKTFRQQQQCLLEKLCIMGKE